MEQHLQQASMIDDFNETANLKSAGATLNEQETNPSSIGFDCNICLDLVQDPVVTFCGHLYCWPCIYRWISFQDTSPENPDLQNPQCPVCKAEVSEKTLIPLYGRGQALSKDKLSHPIPHRPSSPRRAESVFSPNRNSSNRSNPLHTGSYMAAPMLGHGGSATHLADPMIGMFGEMVYARIFGNSETTLYSYPNSYHLAGINTPRLRRRMMQTDRSLSRVCFFLFCCMMLCLLLF